MRTLLEFGSSSSNSEIYDFLELRLRIITDVAEYIVDI
jgi:hypothetical protein